ncbi:triple tyrosine motif-containing protein [Clostridium sp. YIM B02515]|uniref:Triple tyrosine motif-containing protein n=1 Tax=Clostridium rhizosphaerae TaxID=2803861 RepID=A0ABS1TCV0_9CLOT|nr:triple tyrosine motif-containing protein [Clostridium rhizosphaerae]MBL4937184.1 triple tyrosine motif-containing protein [Clostridium rhizosphaerae]
MNDISIVFNVESPQEKNTKIVMSIDEKPKERLQYKFIVGSDGTWETLKDFSEGESVEWLPKKEGKYTIMVQAKEKDSSKSFDYFAKADYTIGEEEKLIKHIYLDKSKLKIGDKLYLSVETSVVPVVYRYWIKEKENWNLIKDYSAENTLALSVRETGEQEILVECKTLESKNKFDDFEKVKFEVEGIKKLEITNFECLISDMIVNSELIFQVEADYEDSRMILYKFIKFNPDGTSECVQDYSTKRMVSFSEKVYGEYKLLCLTKDMYSPKEYDDRAIINYNVKPYMDIVIQSFSSDLSSPQVCESIVTLKAVVSGGKELLYRFKIDGNNSEDSGYIRNNTYAWKTKKSGEYNIELWVKDVSYESSFEAASSLNFKIDEYCNDPVVINEVSLDRNNRLLKNEVVKVKVIASGGTELRYSFIEKKDGKPINKIEYGTCNWVNFSAEEKGNYEVEVRVKDKYSTREYDSHSIVLVEVFDYMPAVIEHILSNAKEHYLVGDTIEYNIITQNTKKTILRYVLSINGQKVEETDFVKEKKYKFTPKCSGNYLIEIYAKNQDSDKEFDTKKDIRIKVQDALPITNTKIQCDRTKVIVNEGVTFTADCSGGKDVLYEFYLMNKGDWELMQNYSKKNYYSFMPFSKGTYRILVLTRSSLKKCSYEDYDMLEFLVE